MYRGRDALVVVKPAQRLPPSLLAALPFDNANLLTDTVLFSNPACAVSHSACSAAEISEVPLSHNRRKLTG